METKIACPNCKKSDLCEKSDYKNIGTFAAPIWAVQCHHCEKFIKSKTEKKDFPKNSNLILERDLETGGIIIGTKDKIIVKNKNGNAFERAEKGDIKEYWTQLFFKEHYSDYGFKSINGPFDIGPDFTTSGGIGIEIERVWQSYFNHGHQTNENFSKVKYLVLLSPEEPPTDKLKLLPDNILHIDIIKFVP